MITIWKVKIKEGERGTFMEKYNLFSGAEGFIECQFYKTGNTDLIAVESWASQEAHKSFVQSLVEGVMGELFSLLEGQPEMYECELGKLIK